MSGINIRFDQKHRCVVDGSSVTFGIFCHHHTPPNVDHPAYDTVQALLDAGVELEDLHLWYRVAIRTSDEAAVEGFLSNLPAEWFEVHGSSQTTLGRGSARV